MTEKFQTLEDLYKILAGVPDRDSIYLYSADGEHLYNTIRFVESKRTDGSTETDAFLSLGAEGKPFWVEGPVC